MILNMQKLTLIGFLADKESILRDLMRKKCVQIEGAESIRDYDSISSITVPGVCQTYELEQELTKFNAAIRAVSPYEQKGGLFAKKERAEFSSMFDQSLFAESCQLRDEINEVSRQINEQKSFVARAQLQITSLEPWAGLDLDLGVTGTRSTALMYLTAGADVDLNELQKQLEEATSLCMVHTVSSSSELNCLLLICHRSAQPQVLDVLKGFNTNRPDFGQLNGTPAENISLLKGRIESSTKEIERLTEQLKVAATSALLLKTGSDMVEVQIDDQKVRQNIFQTQSVFALTGWIVADDAPMLQKLLDRYQCYYTLAQPDEQDDPPIKLKNSKFVKPYEVITEMYSLPAPNGIDPTPFLTPFFILFFGMMLADAGYGLIIFLLCLIGLKKAKPDEGFLKNAMQIGVSCGLSTIFWGVMYGGYFGNLITQISESWFGKTVTVPAVFDMLNDTDVGHGTFVHPGCSSSVHRYGNQDLHDGKTRSPDGWTDGCRSVVSGPDRSADDDSACCIQSRYGTGNRRCSRTDPDTGSPRKEHPHATNQRRDEPVRHHRLPVGCTVLLAYPGAGSCRRHHCKRL